MSQAEVNIELLLETVRRDAVVSESYDPLLFPFTEVGFCMHCGEYYSLTQPVFDADPVQHPWGGAF